MSWLTAARAPLALVNQINESTVRHNAAAEEKRLQLLESVDHDNALALDIVRLFAREAPPRLHLLRGAVERADMTAIADAAHSLRGSAANFGEDPLLESLSEIEALAGRGDLRACVAIIGRIETQTTALLDVLRTWEEPLRCAS